MLSPASHVYSSTSVSYVVCSLQVCGKHGDSLLHSALSVFIETSARLSSVSALSSNQKGQSYAIEALYVLLFLIIVFFSLRSDSVCFNVSQARLLQARLATSNFLLSCG